MTLMSSKYVDHHQTKFDSVFLNPIDSWTYVKVLQQEIEFLKSQYQDHDTGHLRTAVSVLEHRVKELL